MRLLILIFILSSCSATHHYNKALKKGLEVKPVIKKIKLTDTLTINGKDSIIERIITIDCPEPIIQTKWKVRFDNKRFKDSIKIFRKIYSDSLKHSIKSAKVEFKVSKQENKTLRTKTRQENKRSWWWFWVLVGVTLSFTVKTLLKRLRVL